MTEKSRDQVRKLQQAIENFTHAGHEPLFDAEYEQDKARVRNRALNLLEHRARSESELRERLLEAECEPALVSDVIEDLRHSGLVDDVDFAREWVRQRHGRRGKSRKALDMELQAKGVSQSVRGDALEQIDDSDEEAMAREVAEKKARTIRDVPADRAEYDKFLARVVGVVARRGYPQSMSFRIAKEALDSRLEELN